ncbi:MAG: sensor histidine kinase, partial [Limisphaerales bacterium]
MIRPGPQPGFRFTARGTAVTLAVAGVIGLLLASQMVLFTNAINRPLPWSAALASGLRDTLLWVLLLPVIFRVSARFPFNDGRWKTSLPAHLLAVAGVILLYSNLHTLVTHVLWADVLEPTRWGFGRGGGGGSRRGPPPSPPSWYDLNRFFITTRIHFLVLTYGLLAGIWHWLEHNRRLRDRERQAIELSRQLAEARLQALRMQLNPHFLFNTLNAIASLVHRSPHAADEMIGCLSDFLRLTLAGGSRTEIPLREELEFARRYLDIERVRFGERLLVEESIAPDTLDAVVPALVLQPLIENAVRHGIEPGMSGGTIRLATRRDGGTLELRVSD